MEGPALERAQERLRRHLELPPEQAAAVARRCLLHNRDRRLHETIVLRGAPGAVKQIVEAVPVHRVGGAVEHDRPGLLLVSLHYGPYSSLLWLALVREAARGGLPAVAFLADRGRDPNLRLPAAKTDELVRCGVLDEQAFTVLDAGQGAAGAARAMAAVLAADQAVLVLPDAYYLPPGHRRALTVQVGRGRVGLPRGVEWLARHTGCRVAATWLRPAGDGHELVIAPAASARAALGLLFEQVTAEPSPWEGWLREQSLV